MTFSGIVISLTLSLAGASIVGCVRWLKALRSDITAIKDNHLQHIQSGIEDQTKKMDKQTDILASIDKK